jgi:hypothetical protein
VRLQLLTEELAQAALGESFTLEGDDLVPLFEH